MPCTHQFTQIRERQDGWFVWACTACRREVVVLAGQLP